MTKEEAIKLFQDNIKVLNTMIECQPHNDYFTDKKEAIEMAINALRKQINNDLVQAN